LGRLQIKKRILKRRVNYGRTKYEYNIYIGKEKIATICHLDIVYTFLSALSDRWCCETYLDITIKRRIIEETQAGE